MISYSNAVQEAADSERKMQLTLRAMVGSVISERDRLLQYSVGEVYQELSLFIQEVEEKNRPREKL